MANEFEVTKLYATVEPRIAKGFEAKIKAQMTAAFRRAQVNIRPTLDRNEMSKIAAELKTIGRNIRVSIKADVDVDASSLRQVTRDLRALNRIADNKSVSINVEVHGDKIAIAQLAEIAKTRTAKIKTDVDKDSIRRAGANVTNGIGSALSGAAESLDGFGKSFGRLNDVAGVAGVVVSGVAKTVGTFGKAANSAASAGLSLGEAIIGMAATGATQAVVIAITAVILAFVAALAAGVLAIIGFTIAAVLMGAIVTALAVALTGFGAAITATTATLAGLGAGIGVIALALVPVVKAFTQFMNVQDESTKSGESAANSARSQAAALRAANSSVRSAQEGILQAQRRVRDASESLSAAYKSQLRAREDLNRAEQKALDNLERLRRESRDAADDVESADLALKEARDRLAALNPASASLDDYRRALLDVKNAEEDLSDAQIDKPVKEKAYQEALKKGVKQSDEYIAAQDALQDANKRVRDAQEQVGDATRAQQEAVSRLRDAELSRIDATQRSASATGGLTSAQSKLNDQLGKLTPAGVAFFNTLKGIWTWLQKLSDIAQTAFLPGLTAAFGELRTFAPLVEGAVKNIGTTLGRLSTDFASIFRDKGAQLGLRELVDAANNAVKVFGSSAITVIKQLIPTIGALAKFSAPVVAAFAKGLEVVGNNLSKFLTLLYGTKTIDAFARVVPVLLEGVTSLLVIIGESIRPIAMSFAEVAVPFLNAVKSFAAGFMSIIEALSLADAGDNTFSLLEGFLSLLDSLGRAMQQLVNNGVIETLSNTMGEALNILGEGIVNLTKNEEAMDGLNAMFEAMPALMEAVMRSLPDLVELMAYFLEVSSQLAEGGLPGLIKVLTFVITPLIAVLDALVHVFNAIGDAINGAVGSIGGAMNGVAGFVKGGVQGFGKVVGKLFGDNDKPTVGMRADLSKTNDVVKSFSTTLNNASFNSLPDFTAGITRVETQTIDLGDAIDNLQSKVAQERAEEERTKQVTEKWKDAQKSLKTAISENGRVITGQSDAAIKNRDAFKEATRASYDKMLQDIKSGVPMQDAIDKHKARVLALQDEFGKSKSAREETTRLIEKYGQIPANVKTLLQLLGYKDVNTAVIDILTKQEAAKKGLTLEQARENVKRDAINADRRGLATGGPATTMDKMFRGKVRGPGSGTADKIKALLSHGEYVIKRSTVDKLGQPFFDYVNRTGKIPTDDLLPPQFATGGPVTWPFQFDFSKTLLDPNWPETEYGGGSEGSYNGVLGSGSVMGFKRMFALIKEAFPNQRLLSGFRKNSRTLSGNRSYHASGRAVDLSPIRATAEWIAQNYGKKTKELITPWQDVNLHNGKPHHYSGDVYAQHAGTGRFKGNAHIHWAMANGGLVSGLGTGIQDKVLAALSNGEFVMSAKATKAIGARNLAAMNQWGKLSTKSPINGMLDVNTAGRVPHGRASGYMDHSRNVEMNITVAEPHHVDMMVNRMNAWM